MMDRKMDGHSLHDFQIGVFVASKEGIPAISAHNVLIGVDMVIICKCQKGTIIRRNLEYTRLHSHVEIVSDRRCLSHLANPIPLRALIAQKQVIPDGFPLLFARGPGENAQQKRPKLASQTGLHGGEEDGLPIRRWNGKGVGLEEGMQNWVPF
jgi:hypothetical protein